MTEFGKTPYYSADEFAEMGFQMVIYPVTSLRVAAKAYERVFEIINDRAQKKAFLICKREVNYTSLFLMMNLREWIGDCQNIINKRTIKVKDSVPG